jgi:hypothetical protein
MSSTTLSFDARLRRLANKHRKYANGVVGRMGQDGLVRPVPRRALPRFPLRAVVILLAVAFVVKAMMFDALGQAAYDARVTALAQGNLMEQAGAWVMQADPATVMVAGWVGMVRG